MQRCATALGEKAEAARDSRRRTSSGLMTELGFYTGPIDGVWNQELTDAIKALQRELGVPETGVLDAATLQADLRPRASPPARTTTTAPPGPRRPPATTAPPATTVPPTTPRAGDDNAADHGTAGDCAADHSEPPADPLADARRSRSRTRPRAYSDYLAC